MKPLFILLSALAFGAASAAHAQHDMKSMKGMESDAKPKADAKKADAKKGQTHKATGVVKRIDAKGERVSIAHEPVKSLNWPGMTMYFKVRDKALLSKLSEDQKIEFEFVRQGKDYVITSAK